MILIVSVPQDSSKVMQRSIVVISKPAGQAGKLSA